jgi:IPT/TIG domain.
LAPGTKVVLNIIGRNFGNSPMVFIGNKVSLIIHSNDTDISCVLPAPSFGLSIQVVTVYRTDLKMYSPGKTLNYIHYSTVKPVLYPPNLNPVIITSNNNSEFVVPVTANRLFNGCSCYANDLKGNFLYLSSSFSQCVFQGLLSQNYTFYLCCFGNCATYQFYAVADLQLNNTSKSQIYSHGLYPINLVYSFTGPCVNSYVLFNVGPYVLRSSNPCSYSSTLIMPYFHSSIKSVYVSISLNSGLSYSGKSLEIVLTGYCSTGEYQSDGSCMPCPAGYYCNHTFASAASYFFTPIPCDLGYYQNETGQTGCKICPLGSQCFCRGSSIFYPCDSGYVCDSEGTTKR